MEAPPRQRCARAFQASTAPREAQVRQARRAPRRTPAPVVKRNQCGAIQPGRGALPAAVRQRCVWLATTVSQPHTPWRRARARAPATVGTIVTLAVQTSQARAAPQDSRVWEERLHRRFALMRVTTAAAVRRAPLEQCARRGILVHLLDRLCTLRTHVTAHANATVANTAHLAVPPQTRHARPAPLARGVVARLRSPCLVPEAPARTAQRRRAKTGSLVLQDSTASAAMHPLCHAAALRAPTVLPHRS